MDADLTQQSRGDDNRQRYRHWVVPCLLLLIGTASLMIDVPVASQFTDEFRHPALDQSPLRQIVEACEAFGHGFGATLIIIAVGIISPQRFWCLPWMFGGSLGAGLAANIIKLVVRRARPRDFNWTAGSVWHTFLSESNDGVPMQSFPSAHTAVAVGLAVMLSALYPRGRWLFVVLALLVGLQRIVTSAHFPSDVFAGAAVGWIVGVLCAVGMKRQLETTPAKHQP